MRRLLATACGLGISLGVLLLMVLQRHVAEIDDGEGRRAPETNAKRRVGTLLSPLLCLALAGCKTVHSVDVASHTDAATAAQIETHETKSEGPEHIVMTVEEFSQLCDPEQKLSTIAPSAVVLSGPKVPQVIRRTVTVTDRGPSLDDLRTISSLQSKLNTATTVKTKDESKPGGIFSLWFLVGLLPLVAGVLVWKLKPSLFGVAFGALKALFGRKTS